MSSIKVQQSAYLRAIGVEQYQQRLSSEQMVAVHSLFAPGQGVKGQFLTSASAEANANLLSAILLATGLQSESTVMPMSAIQDQGQFTLCFGDHLSKKLPALARAPLVTHDLDAMLTNPLFKKEVWSMMCQALGR